MSDTIYFWFDANSDPLASFTEPEDAVPFVKIVYEGERPVLFDEIDQEIGVEG